MVLTEFDQEKYDEMIKEIPIYEKLNISVEEAAAYSGIGQHKIRELMEDPNCDFVLKVGSKKNVIKRKKFETFLMSRMEI